MKTIAYLAPEIPGQSSTFVYQEIFQLGKIGVEVVPFSIHDPVVVTQDSEVASLKARTIYLYKKNFLSVLAGDLLFLLLHPTAFFRGLRKLLHDLMQPECTLRLRGGLLYRFLRGVDLGKKLKAMACEHLHVHFAHVPTDIAMYASAVTGIPYSFTSHANDLYERGWLLAEKVDRSAFAATISDYNKMFILSRRNDPEKVKIVRCGVDSDNFVFAQHSVKRPLKIGSLGRLVTKKGMDTLIAACDLLASRGVVFTLDIAGDGPLGRQLLEQVEELKLQGHVRFSGVLAHAEVAGWMAGLDLFVLACKEDEAGDVDGIPVVMMEAMASGLLVVSTRISGIPELVRQGETGLLVEPNDPVGLADTIESLTDGKVDYQRMAHAALERVREEFDCKKNASRLMNLIENAEKRNC